MLSIDSKNCQSYQINCGKHQGTGFLVEQDTILTVRHVVDDNLDEPKAPIYVVIDGNEYEFRIIGPQEKDMDNATLVLLQSTETCCITYEKLFRGTYKCSEDDPNIWNSRYFATYGFLTGVYSRDVFNLQCTGQLDYTNEEGAEEYNTGFVPYPNSAHANYEGLSGSPIFDCDGLVGIVGWQRERNGMRLSGLCGNAFFKHLGNLGINMDKNPSTYKKDSLPKALRFSSPDSYMRQLRERLERDDDTPIFITGPAGIGKHWLVVNYGHAYRGGNVYYVPFCGDWDDTIEKIPSLENAGSHDESRNLLIIDGFKAEQEQIQSLIDEYKKKCPESVRLIITTDLCGKAVCEDPLELTPPDDAYLSTIIENLLFPRKMDREDMQQLFALADRNPQMVWLFAKAMKRFSLDGLLKILKEPWRLQEEPWSKEKFKLSYKSEGVENDILSHITAIADSSKMEPRYKEILALAIVNSDMSAKDFRHCLPENAHLKAFDNMICQRHLSEDEDGRLKIPVFLRLACDAQGVYAPSHMHVKFQEKKAKLKSFGSTQQQSESDAETLLRQLAEICASDVDEYEKYFQTRHAAVHQMIPDLENFDKLMNNAFAACYSGKNGYDDMKQAYQLLEKLYPGGREMQRDVFGGKYYAVCSDYLYQATHGAKDGRQRYANSLERFLQIDPEFLSPFFHRHIQLSLFYREVKKDERAEWEVLEQAAEIKNVPPAVMNTNEYAEIFNLMGEYCYHRRKHREDYLEKAIKYYRRAIEYRSRATRPNQRGMVKALQYLAICQHENGSLDDALSTADYALKKDLEHYNAGNADKIDTLYYDYDCVVVYCCEKAQKSGERKVAEDSLNGAKTYVQDMCMCLSGDSRLETHKKELEEFIVRAQAYFEDMYCIK